MHPKYYKLAKSQPELSTCPSRKNLLPLRLHMDMSLTSQRYSLICPPKLGRFENSAPFHCSLMQPAADAMKEALKDVQFEKPIIDVVSNVTAQPVRTHTNYFSFYAFILFLAPPLTRFRHVQFLDQKRERHF